ncbi:MAG: DUF4097 family beta strand repeat protein [Actinobacteria bacterium]|nr:DUF4097 family beta strand repeat protein [Actinomycetota bacterium]
MTTKHFPLTGPITLLARVGRGSIRVTAVDEAQEASVTAVTRSAGSDLIDRMTIELRGHILHVTAPRQGGIFDVFGGRKNEAVDVEVTVPSGTPLTIASFTATIEAVGRNGNCDFASGASDIRAQFVDGDLRIRTGSGNCRVKQVTGSVQARAGHGGLEVGSAHGPVHFRSGAGGASLRAIFGDVDLASGSGEFRVGIPAGVSARVDATTGAGRVDSQFPIDSVSTRTVQITIRARTGSGDVHLFRAAA